MQEKWNRWSMRKITPQDIEYAIRGGDSSEEPLTELQREIIAIAAGLALEISDPVEFALIQAEAVTRPTPFWLSHHTDVITFFIGYLRDRTARSYFHTKRITTFYECPKGEAKE